MKKSILTMMLMFLVTGTMSAQSILDKDRLTRVKNSLSIPAYAQEYKVLIKKADKMLTQTPVTVMNKEMTPASGTKHDYMSLGRYYWPDSTKADGLPWVQRDGRPNPLLKNYDREKLTQLSRTVKTLALAYYLSGDEKYAETATNWVRVFFLNKDTKMNPNLNYSQVVPGRNNGMGRSQGVIDTYSFLDLIEGIGLLESSKAFTKKDSKELKAWFSEYLNWLLTSKQSKEEEQRNNNHGTARDIQVIAFAKYVGNQKVMEEYINAFPEKRMFTQIEPDGSQPKELKRTLAFHYSIFNLDHMTDLFFIARSAGMPIDRLVSADGRSFEKALDFITPYLGKQVEDWPYQQIHDWDKKQYELCNEVYRAYLLHPNRKDYLDLFHKYYRGDDGKKFFTLFYVEPEDAKRLKN